MPLLSERPVGGETGETTIRENKDEPMMVSR